MEGYLYIKSGESYSRVPISEIIFAKAERKFVRIITPDKAYFTRASISWIHQSISNDEFYRIHKSYVVSRHHITGFDKKSVFIAGKKLPIGRHYKVELLKHLLSAGQLINGRVPQKKERPSSL